MVLDRVKLLFIIKRLKYELKLIGFGISYKLLIQIYMVDKFSTLGGPSAGGDPFWILVS